jgi:hypothetical protein
MSFRSWKKKAIGEQNMKSFMCEGKKLGSSAKCKKVINFRKPEKFNKDYHKSDWLSFHWP